MKQKTPFWETKLVADKPIRIDGLYGGLEVLNGAHPQLYLFAEDPGSAADATQAIRLDRNGIVVPGPFKDPYIMALGVTANASAPAVKLRLYNRTPLAVVHQPQAPPILTVGMGSLSGDSVAVSSEKLVAQVLYGTQVIHDGQQIHGRGFWTGYIAGSHMFHVQLRAKSITNVWDTIAIAPAKQRVSGRFTIDLDAAAWDPTFEVSPGTFSSFTPLSRLPVPHAPGCALFAVNLSASNVVSDFHAYVGIRNS